MMSAERSPEGKGKGRALKGPPVEEEMPMKGSPLGPEPTVGIDGQPISEVECSICLEELASVTTLGELPDCSHRFCFSCVQLWSKTENKCPNCRRRFMHINKIERSPEAKSGKGRRRGVQKVKVANKDQGAPPPRSTPSMPSLYSGLAFRDAAFMPDGPFFYGLNIIDPPGNPSSSSSAGLSRAAAMAELLAGRARNYRDPSSRSASSASSAAAAASSSSGPASVARGAGGARFMSEWLAQRRRTSTSSSSSSASASGAAATSSSAASSSSSSAAMGRPVRLTRSPASAARTARVSLPPPPPPRGAASMGAAFGLSPPSGSSSSTRRSNIDPVVEFSRRIRSTPSSGGAAVGRSSAVAVGSSSASAARPAIEDDDDDEVELVGTIPPPAIAVDVGPSQPWDMDLTGGGAMVGGGADDGPDVLEALLGAALEIDLTGSPPATLTARRRRRRPQSASRTSASPAPVMAVAGGGGAAAAPEIVYLDDNDDDDSGTEDLAASPSRRSARKRRRVTVWE